VAHRDRRNVGERDVDSDACPRCLSADINFDLNTTPFDNAVSNDIFIYVGPGKCNFQLSKTLVHTPKRLIIHFGFVGLIEQKGEDIKESSK